MKERGALGANWSELLESLAAVPSHSGAVPHVRVVVPASARSRRRASAPVLQRTYMEAVLDDLRATRDECNAAVEEIASGGGVARVVRKPLASLVERLWVRAEHAFACARLDLGRIKELKSEFPDARRNFWLQPDPADVAAAEKLGVLWGAASRTVALLKAFQHRAYDAETRTLIGWIARELMVAARSCKAAPKARSWVDPDLLQLLTNGNVPPSGNQVGLRRIKEELEYLEGINLVNAAVRSAFNGLTYHVKMIRAGRRDLPHEFVRVEHFLGFLLERMVPLSDARVQRILKPLLVEQSPLPVVAGELLREAAALGVTQRKERVAARERPRQARRQGRKSNGRMIIVGGEVNSWGLDALREEFGEDVHWFSANRGRGHRQDFASWIKHPRTRYAVVLVGYTSHAVSRMVQDAVVGSNARLVMIPRGYSPARVRLEIQRQASGLRGA